LEGITYRELDAGLFCGHECKDMVLCSGEDAFKNSQIRDNTAGIEVLESIEDQVISMVGDAQVIVTRINGT